MNRVVIAGLAAHWVVLFGLMAFQAAGFGTGGQAALSVPGFALAGVLALVAALYAWLCLAGLSASCRQARQIADIAEAATGCAVLAVTGLWLAGWEQALVGASRTALAAQVAALAVTYMAVRYALTRVAPQRTDTATAVARRLALGAVHNSMLGRFSGRRPVQKDESDPCAGS